MENKVAQMFVLWYIKNASKAISEIKVSGGDYEWWYSFVVFLLIL